MGTEVREKKPKILVCVYEQAISEGEWDGNPDYDNVQCFSVKFDRQITIKEAHAFASKIARVKF